MRVKISQLRSSKVVQAAVLAFASASVAGCADSGRYGDGPGYAPQTANQQTYLGNPQYAPQTTGSIQPAYHAPQPQPEPWYGRPWQSPQAAPPSYQPQPYPQQPYPTQPNYQTQAAPTVYPSPLQPLAAEKPKPVAQPQMVLQPGPRVASLPAKPAATQAVQPMPAKPAALQPMPAAAPVAQIPRRATAPATTGSLNQQQKPQPVAQPMPAPAPGAQAPRNESRQLASNWSATGGSYITMRPGDSISTISERYGVPVTAIMSANNFADATRVQPGQQVLIPTYIYNNGQASADPVSPAHVAAQPVSPALPKGGEHVVRHGESLDSIARMYGIPRDKLQAANHMHGDAALKPGQKLEIPLIGGRHVAEAVTPAPVVPSTPVKQTPVAQAAPAPVKGPEQKVASNPAPVDPGIMVAQEPKPSLDAPRADPKAVTSFRWPVRGRVIEAFGASTNGNRNDGINLAVPEGTSVKSAEDGEVIYSGNELKGYGNVVLIKHASGWVTVYAHASDLLVNKGDKVTRGQIIARAGATGNVTQPQLHFELRKGDKPVDPKTYLTN